VKLALAEKSATALNTTIELDCSLGFVALEKMIEQVPQSPSENEIRFHTIEEPLRMFMILPEDHPAAPMIVLWAFVQFDDGTYLQQSHCGFGDPAATQEAVGRLNGDQSTSGRGFTIYPPIGKDFQAK